MPSATAGKRSTAGCYRRQEGGSASQYVANMYVPTGRPGTPMWTGPDIDYSKPWFKQRDGEWYCFLCSAYANEGHVTSDRHQKRAANPEWYGFPVEGSPTAAEYSGIWDQPWFEDRPHSEPFCKLCNQIATVAHVESEKHRKRAEYPESYGFTRSGEAQLCLPAPPTTVRWEQFWCAEHKAHYYHNRATGETTWMVPSDREVVQDTSAGSASTFSAAPSSNAIVPAASSSSLPYAAPSAVPLAPRRTPIYDFPWFEAREGEWYCLLCSRWATEGHIASENHVKRASYPEWYGFPGHGQPMLPAIQDRPAVSAAPTQSTFDWGVQQQPQPQPQAYFQQLPFQPQQPQQQQPQQHVQQAVQQLSAQGQSHMQSQPVGPSVASSLQPTEQAHTSNLSSVPTYAKPKPDVPFPWDAVWSDEYSEWYFHNKRTSTTQWEDPQQSAETEDTTEEC